MDYEVLKLELGIVIILEVLCLSGCSCIIFKHLHDKDWENVRFLLIGCMIFVSLFATIFEIVWIGELLGR